MRKSSLLISVLMCCLKFIFAQPGELDYSFGNKGIVTADLGSKVEFASPTKQVIYYNSSIYILSPKGYDYPYQVSIVKIHTDGSLDANYGNNGYSVPIKFGQ